MITPSSRSLKIMFLAAQLFAWHGFTHSRLSASEGPTGDNTVSYHRQVLPVLTRAGCNMGACHGSLNGKGGMKLSLKGEDPASDYAVLTRELQGRRVSIPFPDESLLLKKATGQTPHEGGVRIRPGSQEYALIRTWIAQGCQTDPDARVKLKSFRVEPRQCFVVDPDDRIRIQATAEFTDGRCYDVTGLCATECSNVGVTQVLPTGEVLRETYGETIILVRYLDQVRPVRVVFLPRRPEPEMTDFVPANEIDRLVASQLRAYRIAPAGLAPDHIFLRRAYLDVIGILPTAEEARLFLSDKTLDRREKLIDSLLNRPEFAEYWAQKWSDLLRIEEKSLDKKGSAHFYRWIASQVAQDRPLNEFARDIISSRGSTYVNPAANFYRALRDPYARAEAVAQVFLGVRISCARCHNHPFDRWTLDDYYSFAAAFSRIQYRILSNDVADFLDKHEFVGEQIVYLAPDAVISHPRTGERVAPRLLGGPSVTQSDYAQAVADWIADPDNPYFARTQINRIWRHLMKRGLVEPNDDFRDTNPPSNPDLLEWLAKDFAKHGFRLKHAIKRIMSSRTYQLSAICQETAFPEDESHFSRSLMTPLEAEQLYDALVQVTGVAIKFDGYPKGLRAKQIPTPPVIPRRGGQLGVGERFLKVFGKPDRLLSCECERSDDRNLLQAFQMITGELVNTMLSETNNRLGQWLSLGLNDEEILDELYLSSLSRFPSQNERNKLLEFIHLGNNRRASFEDILWALLNSKEFLLRQ